MDSFTAQFQEMSDEELMVAFVERDQMVPEAQAAIEAEFDSRGLDDNEAIALWQDITEDRKKAQSKQSLIARLFFGFWIRR